MKRAAQHPTSAKAPEKHIPTRSSQNRPRKTKILIVGEGQETEPNYFRGLREEPEVREKFAITVRRGHGFDQEKVVKEAINHKRKAQNRAEAYDEVWCVVDVESPSKQDALRRACELAKNNGITLWLSNPSFEVWFLLHFEKKARPYQDYGALKVQLDKHWQLIFGREYEKNDEHIYTRLRQYIAIGVSNARWVLGKSSSKFNKRRV